MPSQTIQAYNWWSFSKSLQRPGHGDPGQSLVPCWSSVPNSISKRLPLALLVPPLSFQVVRGSRPTAGPSPSPLLCEGHGNKAHPSEVSQDSCNRTQFLHGSALPSTEGWHLGRASREGDSWAEPKTGAGGGRAPPSRSEPQQTS